MSFDDPQHEPSGSDYLPVAAMELLRRRADLLRQVRSFFDNRGFLEVETPLLSADTVVDRHLDPFGVECGGRTFWLQTSPEFGMKRLLAAGAGAMYQVTRSFRQGECGRLHNPEFTIVEWYQPGHTMRQGMTLLGELAETILARGPAESVGYGEAFERYAGLDPHKADAAALARAVEEHSIAVPASLDPDDRDGWLDLLLVHLVEPRLGRERPTILYDYPASQAALARVRPGPPPVAERFELYVDGIELANGYQELTDPAELRRRNTRVNRQRARDGKPTLPVESRLLAAMDVGLPDATGVALGFDRLVMVALGAKSLADVTAFTWDRA
ncbi:MAG: EF-P lysine aminoacylase GenX [Pirellulales bacterium]|nr:EF-P lysine aminoacylase GenX [Pirellulales bacterium]